MAQKRFIANCWKTLESSPNEYISFNLPIVVKTCAVSRLRCLVQVKVLCEDVSGNEYDSGHIFCDEV